MTEKKSTPAAAKDVSTTGKDNTVDVEDTAAINEKDAPEDGGPVTMADVAAINGIGLAPDASRVAEVGPQDVFISEGMRNDLELNGWTIDPTTGRKVVLDK